MRWNNRKAARVHFERKHLVNIMGVDGTWRRSCALLDVSASGARLEVEGSTDVLKTQEFFLVLSSTGMAFPPVRIGLGQRGTGRRSIQHGEGKGERARGQE
jgi:hypothetical protein